MSLSALSLFLISRTFPLISSFAFRALGSPTLFIFSSIAPRSYELDEITEVLTGETEEEREAKRMMKEAAAKKAEEEVRRAHAPGDSCAPSHTHTHCI